MNAVETSLQALRSRVTVLERVIKLLADSLVRPQLYLYSSDRGFRYEKPDARHFCLLKGVRVVSALNASLELARLGYTQEIAVLVRTLVECTTHIEYVVDPGNREGHRAEVKRYIDAFFADFRRHPEAEIKKAQVPQGAVHAAIGGTLDRIAEQYGEAVGRIPAANLYSKTYRIFSNYVHCKYPEIMDLYGGTAGRFHLSGMSGTAKDCENLAILESFITTASNAFVIMIQGLNLRNLLEGDQALVAWYNECVGG